jgi:hypothetical protein
MVLWEQPVQQGLPEVPLIQEQLVLQDQQLIQEQLEILETLVQQELLQLLLDQQDLLDHLEI